MPHRIEETVARGICSGCGACSIATGGAIKVSLGRTRTYEADLSGASEEEIRTASRVCPFSDEALGENELGVPHPGGGEKHDPRLGIWTSIQAGRRNDEASLLGSSSGGLTSWLLEELLSSGEVDCVVSVGRESGEELFAYSMATTTDDIRAARKSQYYAVTLAEVLARALQKYRRIAIVGVPCFIKASRLLAEADPLVAGRIAYYVGLVCGHLKSQYYPVSLAWQLGVPGSELAAVDFRVKAPGRASAEYDFEATTTTGEARRRATRTLVGGNWGHGAFQLEACNFCDDIFAETADIVFGDAWLPRFETDWRGTNLIVSRNAHIDDLLRVGATRGEVTLMDLSPDEAARSQAGNFRHRWTGLAVRLADDIAAGLSVPRKRVRPDEFAVPAARLRLIRQRRALSTLTHEAFLEAQETGDIDRYLRPVGREIRTYRRLEGSLPRRVARRIRIEIRRVRARWPQRRPRVGA